MSVFAANPTRICRNKKAYVVIDDPNGRRSMTPNPRDTKVAVRRSPSWEGVAIVP
jgi:hypothetical protein